MKDRLTRTLVSARVLTFDCYGTLIDWETGLREAIRSAFPSAAPNPLALFFDAYLRHEMAVEAGPFRIYRNVVAEAAERAAAELGLALPRQAAHRLGASVGTWPPFPDTREALQSLRHRCRLGILSNVDRDLFAETAKHLGVEFDFVATAEDVNSYKPAHPHFDLGRVLVDRLPGFGDAGSEPIRAGTPDGWAHVAQSLLHDGVPARELGLPFVWINRRGEKNRTQVEPIAEFPDLISLARCMATGPS